MRASFEPDYEDEPDLDRSERPINFKAKDWIKLINGERLWMMYSPHGEHGSYPEGSITHESLRGATPEEWLTTIVEHAIRQDRAQREKESKCPK